MNTWLVVTWCVIDSLLVLTGLGVVYVGWRLVRVLERMYHDGEVPGG